MVKRISAVMFLVLVISFGSAAYANEPSLLIMPILPENQEKGITNYISINSNEEDVLVQTIEFIVKNNSKFPIKLDVIPLNALTSPNGIIQYTEKSEIKNASLMKELYSFRKYLDTENEIRVDPMSEEYVKVPILMPSQEGTVLGAIGFQMTVLENKVKNEAQFKIKNEINNIFGLQVNFGTDKEVKFIFDKPFIERTLSSYDIRLPVTLGSPHMLKGVLLEYKVWNEKGELVFESNSIKRLDFAPETKANIAIPWEADSLIEGEQYRISATLTYGDDAYSYEGIFSLAEGNNTPNQNNSSDKTPTIINKYELFIWLYSLATLLLLLVLFLCFISKKKYVLYSDSYSTPELLNSDYKRIIKVTVFKVRLPGAQFIHYYKPLKKGGELVGWKHQKTKRT